jgi:hypothetical protein
MKDDAQATISVWMATANTPLQPRLKMEKLHGR